MRPPLLHTTNLCDRETCAASASCPDEVCRDPAPPPLGVAEATRFEVVTCLDLFCVLQSKVDSTWAFTSENFPNTADPSLPSFAGGRRAPEKVWSGLANMDDPLISTFACSVIVEGVVGGCLVPTGQRTMTAPLSPHVIMHDGTHDTSLCFCLVEMQVILECSCREVHPHRPVTTWSARAVRQIPWHMYMAVFLLVRVSRGTDAQYGIVKSDAACGNTMPRALVRRKQARLGLRLLCAL